MKTSLYIPTGQLTFFIKAFRIIESESELVNRVLPDTSFAMAFCFAGQISYLHDNNKTALSATALSGLRKSVRLINYAPKTSALIVQFKETGISAFLKQPAHELFEESVSLDSFFPQSEISVIEERLAEAKSNQERIDIIEAFLHAKLYFTKTDSLVSEAIQRIHTTNGTIRIRELAADLYISQDAFEKRFRKATGASPKQFSSIIKMKSIIVQNSVPASFRDMALENGYYDQAHFNKDFKLFTGLSPTDFFKSGSYW